MMAGVVITNLSDPLAVSICATHEARAAHLGRPGTRAQ